MDFDGKEVIFITFSHRTLSDRGQGLCYCIRYATQYLYMYQFLILKDDSREMLEVKRENARVKCYETEKPTALVIIVVRTALFISTALEKQTSLKIKCTWTLCIVGVEFLCQEGDCGHLEKEHGGMNERLEGTAD